MSTIHKEFSIPEIKIIPAAACLTLITLGSVSIYGSTDSAFFIVTAFSVLTLASFIVIIAKHKTAPA